MVAVARMFADERQHSLCDHLEFVASNRAVSLRRPRLRQRTLNPAFRRLLADGWHLMYGFVPGSIFFLDGPVGNLVVERKVGEVRYPRLYRGLSRDFRSSDTRRWRTERTCTTSVPRPKVRVYWNPGPISGDLVT